MALNFKHRLKFSYVSHGGGGSRPSHGGHAISVRHRTAGQHRRHASRSWRRRQQQRSGPAIIPPAHAAAPHKRRHKHKTRRRCSLRRHVLVNIIMTGPAAQQPAAAIHHGHGHGGETQHGPAPRLPSSCSRSVKQPRVVQAAATPTHLMPIGWRPRYPRRDETPPISRMHPLL